MVSGAVAMLFHSQIFLIAFLPAAVAGYFALARNKIAREWFLIAASAVFYAWWDVRFLPLLFVHIAVTWIAARLYGRTGQRAFLTGAIVLNFASLGFFKYWMFLAGSIEAALGISLPAAGIVLPIGISFFTFQLVSYLIDMLRQDAPQYPLRRLALFVMLFPHLIAGPIVRHSEIMPQFDEDPLRAGVEERLARGIVLLILGILLKVALADRLAGVADPLFAAAGSGVPGAAEAWTATIAFALQIYFDFMAYSEMAIGLAVMFGLRFPLNFDVPYRSTSLQEFWRRWHMTLSRFLRDYLYIALGGSREGTARLVIATIATMGLCGLWHGAGWTFVVWGLMHGVGLLVVRAWGLLGRPLPAPVAWLATFGFVAVAFMLFRAPDFAVALRMGEGLVGFGGLGRLPAAGTLVLMAIAMGLALLPRPNPVLVEAWLRPAAPLAAAIALLGVFLVLEVGDGQPASFIYFQF